MYSYCRSELPLYVQECVDCYTRNWRVVEFSQRRYSSSCFDRNRIDKEAVSPTNSQPEFEVDCCYSSFDDTLTYKSDSCTPSSRQSIASLSSVSTSTDTLTPRGSWASFDLRSSVNDPLLPEVLERTPLDIFNEQSVNPRDDDRQDSLFSLYTERDNDDNIERRLAAEIPYEHLGHRILVKCLQLKLDLEVEPIFCSMAIYDAKEKKKLSENFYFDLNTDSIRRMLSTHIPYCDVSTQSRSAIFDVTNPSSDLFLVIRLEKVLQGDIKESIEPYLKEDKVIMDLDYPFLMIHFNILLLASR